MNHKSCIGQDLYEPFKSRLPPSRTADPTPSFVTPQAADYWYHNNLPRKTYILSHISTTCIL